jgi:hypothetical protein
LKTRRSIDREKIVELARWTADIDCPFQTTISLLATKLETTEKEVRGLLGELISAEKIRIKGSFDGDEYFDIFILS